MTLSRVKEQTTQKIFKIKTFSKSIIRIWKQRDDVASISELWASLCPVCQVCYGAKVFNYLQAFGFGLSLKVSTSPF